MGMLSLTQVLTMLEKYFYYLLVCYARDELVDIETLLQI